MPDLLKFIFQLCFPTSNDAVQIFSSKKYKMRECDLAGVRVSRVF